MEALIKQKLTHVNFVCDSGGLGDALARLPTLLYTHNTFPHIYLHIWVGDFAFDLFTRCLPKSPRIIIRKFSDNKKYNESLPCRNFSIGSYTNLSVDMARQAFHALINIEPEVKDLNYLSIPVNDVDITRFQLPEKYIIFCVGFTSLVREFLPKNVNPIIDYVISKGFTPVFLGNDKESEKNKNQFIKGYFRQEIDWNKGINLINKTTLIEAAKVIYGAHTILGIDNGLLHLAATHPSIPIIAGYTTVHSSGRQPTRQNIQGFNMHNIDISPKELPCINCQTKNTMTFDHNFTTCLLNPDAAMEKILCLNLMTSDKFIEKLKLVGV